MQWLSYSYTFVYFSMDMNIMTFIEVFTIITWLVNITGIINTEIASYISYLNTTLMGCHLIYMIFNNNKKLAITYLIFTSIYFIIWMLIARDYLEFSIYNHFMELDLTNDITMMTMFYVYMNDNN